MSLSQKVDKTTKINGKSLTSNINLTKYDIGLSNVDNVSSTNLVSNVNASIGVINSSLRLMTESLSQKVDKSLTINGQTIGNLQSVTVGASVLDQAVLNGKESISNKNQANGYAGLDSTGHIPSYLLSSGGFSYVGVWDAWTNTPSLSSSTSGLAIGSFYVVSVDGNTVLSNVSEWRVNDWAVWVGSKWMRIKNSDEVTSVNSRKGVVTLSKVDVGLSNVNNTSDVDKPVSTAQYLALTGKVDKTTTINGYDLSSSSLILTKGDVGLGSVDNTGDALKPVSTAQQAALDLKVDKATTVNGYGLSSNITLTKSDIGLVNVDNTSDVSKPVSASQQAALNLKVDKTTTVNGYGLSSNISLSKGDVGLGNADNTSDINKPVSTAAQTALDLKVDKTTTVNGHVLSSNVVVSKGDVGLGNADNTSDASKPVSTAQQAVFDSKVDKTTTVNSHALSSNVILTKQDVGLGNVDNTSDASKPVSVYQQSALDGKVDKVTTVNSHALSSNVVLDKSDVGLSNVDNTSDASKPVSTAQQAALNLKVDKTTTVNGYGLSSNITLTKSDVGLSNVDNTSDASKPVSTAQQAGLDLKVDKTTTVNGYELSSNVNLSKSDIGLGNVDNTSDMNKPVSSATQTALNLKVDKTTTVNGYALSSNVTLTKGDVGLGNADNTSDASKPVSTAQQTALNLKVDKTTTVNGHALSSNVSVSKGDVGLGNVDNTSDINKPVSTAQQAVFDSKVDKTTTVNGHALSSNVVVTKGDVGLGSVDNTSDVSKPVSTAQQAVFDSKVDKTITVNTYPLSSDVVLTKMDVGLGNVDNTSDINKPVSSATQTALNLKVDQTTTVNGHSLSSNVTITKGDVGLGNVDNTSDASKPVSLYQQTALDEKVDKTITVNDYPLSNDVVLTKVDIGLNNVDNTSDVSKPVSTAVQSALNLKEDVSNKNAANGYAGLDSTGKISASQVPITGLAFQGSWDASTNTPILQSGVGYSGNYYVVSVQGTTLLDGINDWQMNDWAIFNGAAWQKIANHESVVSVNGYKGAVVLRKSDIWLGNVDNTSDMSKPVSTAQQAALNLKVDKTIMVNGHALSADVVLVKSDVGLANVNNTSDLNKPVSTAQQLALDGKVDKTLTVNGQMLSSNVTLTKGDVGLGNVDNTSDASKPVSTAQQAALDLKADKSIQINGHTLTSNIVLVKSDFGLGNVDNTSDIAKPVSTAGQAALDLKVDKTITVNGFALSSNVTLSKANVGLGNVDNTSDADKPVSTAQQAALDLKTDKSTTINGYALSSNVSLSKGDIGLGSVDNTSDLSKPVSTAQQTALDLKADKSTTVNGYALSSNVVLSKADVGLGNVDNTSDAGKPVSTAGQAALNLKVDKTTTVNGYALSSNISLAKGDVGLGNVDNTSDASKPVSTAQQTALDLKVDKTTTVNGFALSSNVTLSKVNVGLGNVDNTSDVNKPVSTAQQTALNLKVDKTTTVNGFALSSNVTLSKANVGLGNVDNTSDVNKPVSTAQQAALNLKENVSNKNAASGYAGLDEFGKLYAYQLPITGLAYRGEWNAEINEPYLTSGKGDAGDYYVVINKGSINLDEITSWSVSDWAIFNGTRWLRIVNSGLSYRGEWDAGNNEPALESGRGNVGDYYYVIKEGSTNLDEITSWRVSDWAIFNGSKWLRIVNSESVSSVNSYTGNVVLSQWDVGLGNVDNTSDVNKPVSTAQQTALNLKVDKTTTVNGFALSSNVTLTKASVGLGNVDNTSDVNKPVSTAQQTALNLKENTANKNVASGYAGLDSSGKILSSQLPITGTSYKGTWNASTNTPVLTSGSGNAGDYYMVSVSGSTTLNSINVWRVNDWAVFNGTAWLRVVNSESVTSVNSYTGSVVLAKGDVGLGNVDNTSDVNKPVSTAQQTALNLKESTANKNVASGYAGLDSSTKLPSSLLPALTLQSSLNDVQLSSLSDSQLLVYNQSLSKWINAASSGFTLVSNTYTKSDYLVGLSTSYPPVAKLDVNNLSTTGNSNLTGVTNGILNCVCDEYGYATFLNVLSSSSVQLIGPLTVDINGSQVIVSSQTLTGLTSPIQYLYVDNTGTLFSTNMPPETYYGRYSSCIAYLSMENQLEDTGLTGTPWLNASGTMPVMLSFSNSIFKYGSKSLNVQLNQSLCLPVSTQLQCDTGAMPFTIATVTAFHLDFWIYLYNVSTPGYIFYISNAAGSVFCMNLGSTVAATSGTQQLQWEISSNGTSYNVALAQPTVNSITLNSWNYISISYDGDTYSLNINGVNDLSFTGAPMATTGTHIFFNWANNQAFYLDEVIFTPYLRATNTGSPFPLISNSIVGSPYALLLNGTSSTDQYSSIPWYTPIGTFTQGSAFPTLASISLNTTRYMLTPYFPCLCYMNEWTLELRVNYNSGLTFPATFFDVRPLSTQFGITMNVASNTSVTVSVASRLASANVFNAVSVTTTANTWQHIAVTYSSKTGYALYGNGTRVSTSAVVEPVASYPICMLGRAVRNANKTFIGLLNDIRVTPRVLYTGTTYTVPASNLTTNTSRDLIDGTTRIISTQSGSTTTSNVQRLYIGCSRLDTFRSRHYASKQSILPVAKIGNSICYQTNVKSQVRSYKFAANRNVSPQLFSVILDETNQMYVASISSNLSVGWLGTQTVSTTYRLYAPVRMPTSISQVYLGWTAMFAVDVNGNVWSNGRNLRGCLGLGATTYTRNPTLIYSSLTGVAANVQVYPSSLASDTSSALCTFIIENGRMFASGGNSAGQLGLGTVTASQTSFVEVAQISSQAWTAVYNFGLVTYATTTGGQLYACGSNAGGSLGIGNSSNANFSTFTQCVYMDGSSVLTVQSVQSFNDNSNQTSLIVMILLSTGDVYVTGRGTSYTVGMRTTLSAYGLFSFWGPIACNIQDIKVSGSVTGTCVFLRKDGVVFITGQTPNGLCFLNGVVVTARPSVIEGFFDFERVYCSKLFSLSCSPYTTIGCLTLDSSLVVAGNANSITTSLGWLPVTTSIFTFAEPLINERVDDAYFCVNSAATAATTLVRLVNGRILVCGYSPFTGVTEDLTTFVMMPIFD